MTPTLHIETNGHYFRVVECFPGGTSYPIGSPFPTRDEAEAFKDIYQRRNLGEWKPVVGPGPFDA
jgi:hypothetical protein